MTKVFPIFSPSRTADWDRCSTLALLRREGWEPRQVTESLLGRIAGGAFNAAAMLYHTGQKDGHILGAQLASTARQAALSYCDGEANRLEALGIHLRGGAAWDTLSVTVERAVERYIAADPLAGYTVREVELTLEDYGPCRIDLILERDGILYVTELKFARTIRRDYIERRVEEILTSWQIRHYVWAYDDLQRCGGGHTPLLLQPAALLVGATPQFVLRLVPGRLTDEERAMWLQSAKQHWQDMQDERDGKRSVTMAVQHRDQYGVCPYYSACFESYLDDGLMQANYVKVPRDTDKTTTR